MKSRWFSLIITLILSIGVLLTFFNLVVGMREAAAAPEALTVTAVSPTVTQNDLDMPLVISGTGFEDGATAMLGETELQDVTWVSNERLEATLSWGKQPGIYELTVTNPGGDSGTLQDAMTLEQGIGAWTHATGPEGGAVYGIAINPQTPSLIFVELGDGGLFRSTDSGANWQMTSDQIVYNSSVAFGADGQTAYASSGYMPVNLFRSDDDAVNWIPIPINNVSRGNTVFPHPTQADTVFAIATEGYDPIYDGLYRSDNRGEDWIKITEGISGVVPTALAIDAMHPLTMALGTDTGGVYLSTDGGESWSYAAQAMPGSIGWMWFHPSGNGEVWVSAFQGACSVAKSLNPDLSVFTEVLDNGVGICNGHIAFPPLAWGDAYSQTVFYPSYSLRVSNDDGLTWEDWGTWDGSWALEMGLHPTDPQTVYIGSVNGMRLTTDGGATWQTTNHGLTGLSPEVLEVLPDQPGTVLGQNIDSLGLFRLEQGGAAWSFIPVTPPIYTPMYRTTAFTIDPNDPQRMYLAGYEHIMISTDGGQTWPYTTTLPIPPEFNDCAHNTKVLAADPFSPGVILAGVQESCGNWGLDPGTLYLSTDYGETWEQRMVGVPISQVNDIAFDWGNPGTVYAAAAGSGVLRSNNSGLTWEAVNNGLEPQWGQLIETEPNPPYRVYYADGGGLYVSVDQGENWMNQHGAPGGYFGISALHFTRGNPSSFYVASANRLSFSLDSGETWKPATAPLGNRVIWTLGSETPDQRTVLYVSGVGGMYRLTTLPVLLSGMVTDVDTGLPIAGAQVQSDAGLRAVTDASGAYSLTLPSAVYTLTVGAQGYVTQTLGGVELVMQPVTQDFALSSTKAELSGWVWDGYTGLPLESVLVSVDTGESTQTDTDGNYSLLLAPGVYTVTAQADGYPTQTVGGFEIISGTYWLNFSLLNPDVLPQWAQVNKNGFGDPLNGISVLETFQPEGSAPYLYAGVWGNAGEAKMWRSSDGWSWELAGSGWLTPTSYMMDAQVFDGQLYLGLSSPAQLWRTDGTDWQAVDTVGFGDSNNHTLNALGVFEDRIYAALLNDVTGLEIWSSGSGDPGTWSQVNQDGFGGWGSGDVVIDIFAGYLYAGFNNAMGQSQLWRTQDGTDWEPVFTDGLGNPNNGRISMAELNGEFYISFRNIWEGGEVWRSSNGTDWEPVVLGGFGLPGNGRPYGMVVVEGALYVIFSNPNGAQVWRTFDGNFWQRVNLDGWGDTANNFADYNDKSAAVFNFNLYVGTLTNPDGGEIWKLFLAEETRLPFVAK